MRRVAVVVALVLCIAASAEAAPPVTVARFVQGRDRTDVPVFPPGVGDAALAGGKVAWTQRMLDGSWRVKVAAPGEPPTDVAASPRVMPGLHSLGPFGATATGFIASPNRLVWTDFTGYEFGHLWNTVQDRLFTAAPRPGTATQVAGCTSQTLCECPPYGCLYGSRFSAAVDGDVLAYENRLTGTVTIQRPGAPDVQVQTGAKDDYGLSWLGIAGRFVAWEDAPSRSFAAGVVYDWQAGREVYRVPSDERITGIQADGKLLSLTGTGLRWRALPDGTPHDIPDPSPDPIWSAQLAGDAIAFETRHKEILQFPVWTSDLAGHIHRVAAGSWAAGSPGFGFDGRRATWISYICGVSTVLLAEDAATTTAPRPPRCKQPVIEAVHTPEATTTIRRARHGLLAVRLACPSGCRGRLDMTFVDDVPLTTAAARRVDLPASARPKAVHIRPSKRAARLLRRTSQGLNLTVALFARDRHGERVGVTALGNVCRRDACPVPFDLDYP